MRTTPRHRSTVRIALFFAGVAFPIACTSMEKSQLSSGAEPVRSPAPASPTSGSDSTAESDPRAIEIATAEPKVEELAAATPSEDSRSAHRAQKSRPAAVAEKPMDRADVEPSPPPPLKAAPERRVMSISRTIPAQAQMADGAHFDAPVEAGPTGDFEGHDRGINAPTLTENDALSTFAIDVDTAAYSIARRTLVAERMPTASLVRVEEMINYFHYDYEAPTSERHPFSIQADGARSPVDNSKHLLRVGIQARKVKDADRLPANLVFLVDTSCSMTSEDKLGLAKRSLKVAVDHLTEKDRVAITTYAGGVRIVLPPTRATEKHTIKNAIDNLQPGGGTAMESGLTVAYKQAARMLDDKSITRIIVCSDGDANIGATTPEQMLKQVEGYVKEGVTLSTIGFGDGNYKDATMEQIANKGNGNYYYIDTPRMAERVFGRDLTQMIQDVAQDVKIQVEFDKDAVQSYRLVGYENRDVADKDFRNDRVDAGEIGAGHQVTALYELTLKRRAEGKLATVRVRAKEPRGMTAKETAFDVPVAFVERQFESAPEDMRFAVAVMGGSELLRQSPFARGWNYSRVISLISDVHTSDPDRAEFLALMKKAAWLSGESQPVSTR